jgi:hypothetical protein
VSVSAATPLRRDSLRVACLVESSPQASEGWTSRSVVWQHAARAGLEITLKPTGSPLVFELDRYHHAPGPVLGRVRVLSRIVPLEPSGHVRSQSDVVAYGIAEASQDVYEALISGHALDAARTIPTRFRQNVGRRTRARGAGGRFRYDWARPAVHLLRCPPPRLRRFGETAFAMWGLARGQTDGLA